MKAVQCPFLSRIPLAAVSKNASALITYADQCPIMSHAKHYTRMAGNASDMPGMNVTLRC